MMLRLALLTVLVSGCAANEPAKSAANTETQAPRAEARPSAPPVAAPKQEAPAAPPTPASPDDLRGVLQAVIDDEALTPYLHLEQPNRFPLRMSGPDLPQSLQLTKGTKPVVIVADSGRDPKKPVFVITEIEIKGEDATVRYKYEGARGSATLNKPYGRWTIKQSRVAEH